MGEIVRIGHCVDDVQMKQTVKLQLMTSRGSHAKRLHKSIAQNDHTNQLHKTIAQDKMTSHPRMEMSNDAFWMLQSNSGVYGGPETGQSNRILSKSKG